MSAVISQERFPIIFYIEQIQQYMALQSHSLICIGVKLGITSINEYSVFSETGF
jgi:hypothetical protein